MNLSKIILPTLLLGNRDSEFCYFTLSVTELPALQTDSLPSELHFLAIMNNAAMKISFCVNICFQFSLLEIELLDHIITLCLTF